MPDSSGIFYMTERLETILSLIKEGRGVIDVGTDHAYVPIKLAQRGYKGRILASDINSGPLQSARKNAAETGLEGRIEFRLCDGLSECDGSVADTVILAGMGGDLICRILDEAEWTMNPDYSLILQPMTKAEVLRYWLVYNGYNILEDLTVSDSGRLYSVLFVRFSGINENYSDAELYVGRHPDKRLVQKTIETLAKKPDSEFFGSIAEELRKIYENS